jgi:chaperone modulatory protein CbpM
MSSNRTPLFTAVIVYDDQLVSLTELCRNFALSAEQLLSMVEYGIIEPLDFQLSHIHWQFTGNNTLRVQRALRLQHDLDLNIAGAALAIELLDEIKLLRDRLSHKNDKH